MVLKQLDTTERGGKKKKRKERHLSRAPELLDFKIKSHGIMASLIALSDHAAAKWILQKSQTQPPPEMSTHSFRAVDAAQHPPARG